jgi:glycosyltransferase involved in cell wall biosynthesis
MKIPVIINNINLISWPKKMVEDLKKFDNIGEIIIVDNNSTYEPLLEWYSTKPCEIIYSKNLGQSSPWINMIPEKWGFEYYVVTDSDLIFNEIISNGGKAIMSVKEHESGSDRIAEAVKNMNVDIVINVQGDEPFINKKPLEELIEVFKNDIETHPRKIFFKCGE